MLLQLNKSQEFTGIVLPIGHVHKIVRSKIYITLEHFDYVSMARNHIGNKITLHQIKTGTHCVAYNKNIDRSQVIDNPMFVESFTRQISINAKLIN